MELENEDGRFSYIKARWMAQFIFCAIVLSSTMMWGAGKPAFNFSKSGEARPASGSVQGVKQIQEGYDLRVWIGNNLVMGKAAFGAEGPPPICGSIGIGCEYPVGSCVEHLKGMGSWIGGKINGTRYVTETYNGDANDSETQPEPGDSLHPFFWVTSTLDTAYDPNREGYYKKPMNQLGVDDDHDGKIDEDELDGLDNDHDWIRATDDIGADGVPDSLEVGCKGTYNAVTNPDPAFDNYDPSKYDSCHSNPNGTFPLKNNKDRYTELNGIPDHGEPHVDEDYGARSEYDVYVGTTDTARSGNSLRHRKMGIKMFQKSYLYQPSQQLDYHLVRPILPMDYYFVNIGQNTITDVYVGFYADMDVGSVFNAGFEERNYAAYFPNIHTAYVVNPIDRGITPLGLTIAHATKSFDSLKTVFQWFDNDKYPPLGSGDNSLYGWLSGEKGYIYPDQSGSNLSNTKFLISVGPFNDMKPGDTVKVGIGLISGACVSGCPNSLKDNAYLMAGKTKRFYDGIEILNSPELRLNLGRGKVTLDWRTLPGGRNPIDTWDDSNKIAENYPLDNWRRINPPKGHTRGGRTFEGFRLYRSEDPSGNWGSYALLRQFDVKEDEYGFNVGLDSIFTDSNLVIGKPYWYAVTSFAIPNFYLIPKPTRPTPIDTLEADRRSIMGFGAQFDTVFEEGLESSIFQNATRIMIPYAPSIKLNEVKVVPNPYRTDQNYTLENGGWEGRQAAWSERQRVIKFIHLPKECTVRIFSLDGSIVRTFTNIGSPNPSEASWDLISDDNWEVASGIYVFSVESDFGRQIGKFVIIR